MLHNVPERLADAPKMEPKGTPRAVVQLRRTCGIYNTGSTLGPSGHGLALHLLFKCFLVARQPWFP